MGLGGREMGEAVEFLVRISHRGTGIGRFDYDMTVFFSPDISLENCVVGTRISSCK